MDGNSAAAVCTRRTCYDLRSPSRLVDASGRYAGSLAELSRNRAEANGARAADGIHSCGNPAGDGTPLLRIVGIPYNWLFRSDEPIWLAAGFHVPDRFPASAWDWRDPRLGAITLPKRRTWARLF